MGLLETELKEIRQDIKHFRAKKITEEEVQTLIAMYSQTEKRMRLMLQAMALAAKHGKPHLTRMVRSNLIGDGTVIDLSPEELEEEKVLCKLSNKHMTRAECIDFSGSKDNFDNCQGCSVGLECKRLLVGDPLYTA